MISMIPGLYERLTIPADRRATSISKEEGEYIASFLSSIPIRRTLETGFAYGCSTAYILASTGAPHIAIDPYQETYRNLGLYNIAALGLQERLEVIPLPSHLALPQLLARKLSIDFAFIDGGHLFEEVFLDWYFISLLLPDGGYVMLHDKWLKATRVVASFIRSNRSDYKEISTPMRNLYLFQKSGEDKREWTDFVDF